VRLVHSVPWVGASPYGDRFLRDPVVGDEVVFLNRHQQLLRGYVSFKLESGNKDGIQYGGHLKVVTVPGEACVSSSISNEAGETKGSTGAECFNFARAGNCIEDHVFLQGVYYVGVPGPARSLCVECTCTGNSGLPAMNTEGILGLLHATVLPSSAACIVPQTMINACVANLRGSMREARGVPFASVLDCNSTLIQLPRLTWFGDN
jgi:hypothetical protein